MVQKTRPPIRYICARRLWRGLQALRSLLPKMSKIIFDFWPRATSEVGSEVTLDLIWLITWSNGVVRGVGNELVELAELSCEL